MNDFPCIRQGNSHVTKTLYAVTFKYPDLMSECLNKFKSKVAIMVFLFGNYIYFITDNKNQQNIVTLLLTSIWMQFFVLYPDNNLS